MKANTRLLSNFTDVPKILVRRKVADSCGSAYLCKDSQGSTLERG